MWILSWKKYALSKFATFVSIVGALMRYAGVMCLVSTLILAALICIAIGVGLHFCAETIAKNKAVKSASTANAMNSATIQQTSKPTQTNSTSAAAAQLNEASDEQIKCNKCGAIASANTKFCNECGNALIADEPKQKKCLRCGITVDSNSKFCNNCGNEIK